MTTFDPTAYKETTREQWQAAAEPWHRSGAVIGAWLGPATEIVLDLADVQAGSRVLDVAAGAGEQTLTAARRVGPNGHVLATHIAPNLLEYVQKDAWEASLTNVETQALGCRRRSGRRPGKRSSGSCGSSRGRRDSKGRASSWWQRAGSRPAEADSKHTPETDLRAAWASGDTYERWMGRWSRLITQQYVPWLGIPEGASWLDVGCGTGALTQVILEVAAPRSVVGIDPSEGYIAYARDQVKNYRARFHVADAQSLPFDAAGFDAVVSGLVLNFVPEPARAVVAMKRVARSGGTVAAYVWDYAGKMELMRYFLDAAGALNSETRDLDEGRRPPLCNPGSLERLFTDAGLRGVAVRAMDVPTHFQDFDDYWSPFLGGQAPARGYAMSLTEEARADLREHIRRSLPTEPDGSIRLVARTWAVRGRLQ